MTCARSTARRLEFRCNHCGRRSMSPTSLCACGKGLMETDHTSLGHMTWDLLMPPGEGIWRYAAALPDLSVHLSHAECNTPLLQSRRLSTLLKLGLTFKDETRNPTGSFKDRAAALIVSEAAAQNAQGIALTSSGNAASSLALYSALAGIACRVYAPPTIPHGKLLQTEAFGATVFQPCDMDELGLSEAAAGAASAPGWVDGATVAARCPLTLEGYKTISYEIGAIMVPRTIVVPVGAGTLLLGIWKGFRELRDWGLTRTVPRLIGVQSEGWDPLTHAFRRGDTRVTPCFGAKTIAQGVALGNPGIDGVETLRAVRESNGIMVSVNDTATRQAQAQLAREEGILAEPSGALPLAGAIRARDEGFLDAEESVTVIVTGHGMKDTVALAKIAGRHRGDSPWRKRP